MGAKCTGKRTGRVVDSRVYPSGKARYVAPGTVVRLTAVIADDTGATVSLYTIHCQRTGRPISMGGYDLLHSIDPPLKDHSTWIPDGSRVTFTVTMSAAMRKRRRDKDADVTEGEEDRWKKESGDEESRQTTKRRSEPVEPVEQPVEPVEQVERVERV